VHLFYHTLDVIPRSWYTQAELRHDTGEWDIFHVGFLSKFLFKDQWMDPMDKALQLVKAAILKTLLESEETVQPCWSRQLSQALIHLVRCMRKSSRPSYFSIMHSSGFPNLIFIMHPQVFQSSNVPSCVPHHHEGVVCSAHLIASNRWCSSTMISNLVRNSSIIANP